MLVALRLKNCLLIHFIKLSNNMESMHYNRLVFDKFSVDKVNDDAIIMMDVQFIT